MVLNNNMASPANKKGESSESRDQEVRKLLEEAERIKFGKRLIEAKEALSVITGWQEASDDLKNFIMRTCSEAKEWDDVIGPLKNAAEEAELRRTRQEELKSEILRMREEILKEESTKGFRKRNFVDNKERGGKTNCFVCGKVGHIARNCERKAKPWEDLNKNEGNYYSYSNTSDNHTSEKLIQHSNRESVKRRKMTLEGLMNEFPDVFDVNSSEEKITFCKVEKCFINTKIGEKVVKRGTRVPQYLKEKTKVLIESLEKRGVIRKSDSQWRNPIRALEKPDGSVRLVSNLMCLNDLTEKDSYTIPEMKRIVEATVGSNYISIFDLREGYYQVEIAEEHRFKTAFEFDGGVYEWCGMVMGFKNAPMIFQRIMNKIMAGMLGKGVEVYLDDILIHAKTLNEHDRLVKMVLTKLRENNLKVNIKKTQFAVQEAKLLGLTINGKEKIPLEVKKNEAMEFPRPKNTAELRRFLGLSGWFRDFIKNYADVTTHLYALLKTNRNFVWSDKEENEFIKIKQMLREAKNLKLPDYGKEFVLKTDASNTGLGAVLLQKNSEGVLVPIQWASKKLTPTEERYAITEKEMLAIKWAVEKFSYELRGRRFHLITDHRALEQIRIKPEFANNRVNRWIEFIQDYDFSIEYRKGADLVTADALSRIYEANEKDKMNIVNKESNSIHGKKICEGKWEKHVVVIEGEQYWKFDNGIYRKIPLIETRKELVVEMHKRLLHRGLEPIYYRLKQEYYWPGMKNAIRNVIRKCRICVENNRKNGGGSEFVTTSRPLEKIAIDIMKVEEGLNALILIDYYSRLLIAKITMERRSSTIVTILEEIFKKIGYPNEIISDNAKEFISTEFRDMCDHRKIQHSLVSVESHKSNGRVERVIRSLRDGLSKIKGGTQESNLNRLVQVYNNTYHAGIKMTPIEAFADESGIASIENSKEGNYWKQFRKTRREKFRCGDQVLITQRENLGKASKSKKGRYTARGIVMEEFGKDSYLVRDENGKIRKKRHYDLKGHKIAMVETPS